MKIKGCFLKYGEKLGSYVIGTECVLTIPKSIPVVYRPKEFGHHRIIGSCNVMNTNGKLFLKNGYIFEDKLSEGLVKKIINAGGGLSCKYYAMESHLDDNGQKILVRAKLAEVTLIPELISNDHKIEIE